MLHWFLGIAALATAGAAIYESVAPARSAIRFVHSNGLTARRALPESIAPGAAILDYDGDGLMDILLTNSAGPSALYRNRGNFKFSDVSAAAGINTRAFVLGSVACDYNSDGWPDLFLTAYGRNVLYRNNGDGTFVDVAADAGLNDEGLWTAATFFDADGDGDEDLFLGHFAKYDPASEPVCQYQGRYHYCHPLAYPPHPSRFFRNDGGRFVDISEASGIGTHPGKVFGAVATDVNRDGRLDLFVANDSVANFLFINRGGMKFEEKGLEAGVAYSADGNPRSGMGVDAADYDNDGMQDLFVANFNRERFSIYRNRGNLLFTDEAGVTGVGTATQMYSGWGVRFVDIDHDGDDDLFLVNSHPDDQIERISATLTYKEPLLLLENREGKFININASAGDAFQQNYPARGLAMGDLDNDGMPDAVVANTGEAPLVLRHTGTGAGNWVGLDLRPPVAGTIVRWSFKGVARSRLLTAGGSYLSSHDPRVLLGLGSAQLPDWVEVQWPGKEPRRLKGLAPRRYHEVKR